MTDPDATKPTIEGLSDADALELIGALVDHAFDTADSVVVDEAMALAEAIEARGISPEDMATLDYLRANAWDCRWQQRIGDRTEIWDWEQPEVRQQVFLLRRALNSAKLTQWRFAASARFSQISATSSASLAGSSRQGGTGLARLN